MECSDFALHRPENSRQASYPTQRTGTPRVGADKNNFKLTDSPHSLEIQLMTRASETTRTVFVAILAILVLSVSPIESAFATSDSSFAYQGRVRKDGFLINGPVDLRFSLWTAVNGGSQVGPQEERGGVIVDKGLFAVTLNFGPEAFSGDPRWIQLEVRHPAGSGTWTIVSPRQPMTATPYSLFSLAGGEWTRIGANIHYNDGNVGIGTGSPGAKLDVAGGSIRTSDQLISTAATGTAPLQVTSTTMVPNLNAAQLDGFAASAFGRLAAAQTWSAANTFSSALTLGTQGTSTSHAVRADRTISAGTGLTGGGNLTANRTISIANSGVGTTQLANGAVTTAKIADGAVTNVKISAVDASKISSGTLPSARLAGTYSSSLLFTNPSNVYTGNELNLFGSSIAKIDFHFNDSPTNTARIANIDLGLRVVLPDHPTHMIWRGNGRVGIGLNSPSTKLHVDGPVTASAFNTSSDERLKTDISRITNSLRIIDAIDGVRFEWKAPAVVDSEFEPGVHLGFIAQQVEAVLPEAVREDETGLLSMDYSRLTPVLVEAVKELHAELLDRDATIAAQSEELATLRDRLDTLELLVDRLAHQNGVADR